MHLTTPFPSPPLILSHSLRKSLHFLSKNKQNNTHKCHATESPSQDQEYGISLEHR